MQKIFSFLIITSLVCPAFAAAQSAPNSLILSIVTVTDVTTTSATVTWNSNRLASSRVEYGSTIAYQNSSILNPTQSTAHSVVLNNLSPNTLYHYRVISTDSLGHVTVSPDITFTTKKASVVNPTLPSGETAPPVISVISVLTAGTVTAGTATIEWHTDEIATGRVEYGTTAVYGLLTTLDTTLKTVHSFTLSSLLPGTVYHYRVHSKDGSGNGVISGDNIFTTLPGPLDTVAPVISGLTLGLIRKTSAVVSWNTNELTNGYIEYGKNSYSDQITISALGISQGVLIPSLKENTTYQYRVVAKDVKGNSTTSNSSTFATLAKKDTDLSDMKGPVITNMKAESATDNASILWNTDELSTTQVDYGKTILYGTSSSINSAYVTNHTISLTNLTPNTMYYYRVKSVDSFGNTSTSPGTTFITPALSATATDTLSPLISGVSTADINHDSAYILWTTNEAADTQVNYGTTSSYGFLSIQNAALTHVHLQLLTGLFPLTKYHYQVKSRDAARNLGISVDDSFTTDPTPLPHNILSHVQPPVLSGVTSLNVLSNQATIEWNTDEPTNSQIEYGPTSSYGSKIVLESLVLHHTIELGDLTSATEYHFKVISKDENNNTVVSSDHVFITPEVVLPPPPLPDSTPKNPPEIIGITPAVITHDSVTLLWQTTEPAESQVEYGTSESYGSVLNLDGHFSLLHTATVTSLTPGITYHFRIRVTDENDVQIFSPDGIFSTPALPTNPDTVPVIEDVESTPTEEQVPAPNPSPTPSPVLEEETPSSEVPPTDTPSPAPISPEPAPTPSPLPVPTPIPTPPTQNIAGSALHHSAAKITWDTNEATLGQVEYGLTTSYGEIVTTGVDFKIDHEITLTELTASSVYHYRVTSVDARGNTAISNDYTFETLVAPASPTSPSIVPEVSSPEHPSSDSSQSTSFSGGGGGSPFALLPTIINVHAHGADSQVHFSWQHETVPNIIEIVRNTERSPVSPTDGKVVYRGTGTGFVDTNLSNGTLYKYAIFSRTINGSYSAPVEVSVSPKSGVSQQSISKTTITLTRNLSRGTNGDDVRALQSFLARQGFLTSANVVGIFGQRTFDAVVSFQKKYNVSPSLGIVGPKTRAQIQILGGL